MPTLTQETLFGESEETYGEFTAEVDRLLAFTRAITTIVDEARVEITQEGFRAQVMGGASVGMVDVSTGIYHELEAGTVGLNAEQLMGFLSNKPRDGIVGVELSRPYGKLSMTYGQWRVTERVQVLDVDSVRESQALPDLDLPVALEVDVSTITSYLTARDSDSEIEIAVDDGELLVGQLADTTQYSSVMTTEAESDESASSLFSYPYLKKIFTTLRGIGAESACLHLGEEFPVLLDFDAGEVEGTFALAPRLKND